MVSTVTVIKKIEYKGALASFFLNDYKDIDAIFNDMYRTITKQLRVPNSTALHTKTPRRSWQSIVSCN